MVIGQRLFDVVQTYILTPLLYMVMSLL